MATYAIQFITREGGIAAQSIVNHARAHAILDAWRNQGPGTFAVSILIVGASFKERTTLGELAVADVFFNRRDALRFINQLQEQQQ